MSFITVDSSSIPSMTPERADKINKEVPDHLAAFFYINKANKVSYYRKNSWGVMETWNKGTNNWEYCPSINGACVINLPAVPFVDRSESTVEVTKVKYKSGDLTSTVTRSDVVNNNKSSYPILKEVEKSRIEQRAKELAKQNVERRLTDSAKASQNNLHVLKATTSIKDLINKHNVHKYPTHFVKGENNYAFVYVFEKGLWELQPRINHMIGAITITSKVCAQNVIKELNDLGIKPDQLA